MEHPCKNINNYYPNKSQGWWI